jgi:sugar fermentation stimulation protein A
MQFLVPLQQGKLVKRYKRFLTDVALPSGEVITVHCANSGSMLGLLEPGNPVAFSRSLNLERKLPYTLEMVQADGQWVGVNTQWPNVLAAQAITEGLIPALDGYATLRREVKYGANSRIDLLLEHPAENPDGPMAYVEVKNVTTKRNTPAAEFPDAVTSRGVKHLHELMMMKRQGHRAVMLYMVQRSDCSYFTMADDIDPLYGQTLREAVQEGVEIFAHQCIVSPEGIVVDRALECRL